MKEFKLRTWKTEDTKSLAQAANNPNIAKNLRNAFPNPYTSEDAVCFIKDCISANILDTDMVAARSDEALGISHLG